MWLLTSYASSRKPELRRHVSYRSLELATRPASSGSFSQRLRISWISGCLGLISRIRWFFIIAARPGSARACSLAIFSMVADQPYLPETTTHGALARRLDTRTDDRSSTCSFHHLPRPLK